MKNRLFISVLTVALSCSLTSLAFAVDSEGYEEPVNYEMGQDEMSAIEADCNELGTDSELQGEDLAIYVEECISTNTMVLTEDGAEILEEDTSMDPEMASEMNVDMDDVMTDDGELPFVDTEG
jgi:hypothetical protein